MQLQLMKGFLPMDLLLLLGNLHIFPQPVSFKHSQTLKHYQEYKLWLQVQACGTLTYVQRDSEQNNFQRHFSDTVM